MENRAFLRFAKYVVVVCWPSRRVNISCVVASMIFQLEVESHQLFLEELYKEAMRDE